ncbi:hypothetical protein GCM10019016_037240 [Streptomyces prasinosporus]|uniref:Aminotransferase class III-fold pyridoxal phosphate-dependent enzyme n=1 Tax=Streptomyces prasinosporus TaxID=68256 RepID=A0ABP6TMX6_9ACTN
MEQLEYLTGGGITHGFDTRTTATGALRVAGDVRTGRGLAAPRGRGPARGLPLGRPGAAREVRDAAHRAGLLLETAGVGDEVVEPLPPLTVTDGRTEPGLAVLDEAVAAVAGVRGTAA